MYTLLIIWATCGVLSAVLAMIGFHVSPENEIENVNAISLTLVLIACFLAGPLVLAFSLYITLKNMNNDGE
jgi:hypothetical protein